MPPSPVSRSNSSSFPGAYQDSLLTMTPLTNVSLHNVVRASPPEPAKRVGSYSHPYPEPIVPPPPYSDARHALPEGVAPPPRRPQTAPQGFRAALGGPGSLGHRGSSPGSLTPDSTCQVWGDVWAGRRRHTHMHKRQEEPPQQEKNTERKLRYK